MEDNVSGDIKSFVKVDEKEEESKTEATENHELDCKSHETYDINKVNEIEEKICEIEVGDASDESSEISPDAS